MGLGDYPLRFGGWDKGTWGLGVGLGDYPLRFGGWDKGTWGLGVGLGSYRFGVLGGGTRRLGVGTTGYREALRVLGAGLPGGTWGQPSRVLGATWKICIFSPILSRLKYSQTSVVANDLQISYSVKYWPRVSERPFARVLERHFPRVLKRPPYLYICSKIARVNWSLLNRWENFVPSYFPQRLIDRGFFDVRPSRYDIISYDIKIVRYDMTK